MNFYAQPLNDVIVTVCNLFHWFQSQFRVTFYSIPFKRIDVHKIKMEAITANDNVLRFFSL